MTITFSADNAAVQPVPGSYDGDGLWLEKMEFGEVLVTPIAYGLTPLPGRELAFASYRDFRALVYIEEAGIIDLRDGESQTDFDDDDARSIHIAAIERNEDGGRIVGSMRLILSGDAPPNGLDELGLKMNSDLLPVEREFPAAMPVDLRSGDTVVCEISRYISRHESKRQKVAISGGLHQVAVAMVTQHGIGSTYAIVERWLERILRFSRVPLTQLTEPQWIERYGSPNYAVEIHMYELARSYSSLGSSVSLDRVRARAS